MSKKIKALLAVVLCAAMLIAAASPAFAAVDDNGVLRFNKDGKLKIMQISDTQDIDIPREAMIMFMEKALDAEKPDLVVFTGDQIAGGKIKTAEGVYAGIKAILKPVTDRGIPFTFVFGNHDTDEGCPVSRDEQFAYYQTLPGCLAYDADPELYGSGTHNLPIYASKGNDIKFNLWLFDSNDYDRENGGYDYVHQDQIDWYVKTSEELEKKAGHPVPSIAFQHIIVPEVAELLVDSPFKGETGHDHINNFIGNVDGIDLVMCPGVTFQSYGRYISRAVRIFELDENDPWSYNTHLYKYTDAFGWGLYSWYIGAKYGKSPAMWIPIILTAVLGVAAGVGTIVLMNNIIIGATVTAGVIALIYFITHSQQ